MASGNTSIDLLVQQNFLLHLYDPCRPYFSIFRFWNVHDCLASIFKSSIKMFSFRIAYSVFLIKKKIADLKDKPNIVYCVLYDIACILRKHLQVCYKCKRIAVKI